MASDLISRDAMNEMLDELCVMDFIYDKLNELPTVDAVEVVRCKDCIYGSQDPLIDIGTNCGLMGISMLHDSFCSWSMKRDGGSDELV